jgi:pimeloyl-ACP methyl ester carboxylesterase
VTFLHGFALDRRMWSAQAHAMEATYRFLAVDLPGFGPKGAGDAGVHCPAHAVLEVLDARGVERTHLVGHSFGGAVAVDFALARPDRVLSLTLVDAPLLGRVAAIEAWPLCVAFARNGQDDEARRAWLADPLFAPACRIPEVRVALERMAADYACGHWAGRVSNRWLVEDPAGRLGELRAPALVVLGELDTTNFHDMAAEYARLLPSARTATIPGAGHMCSLEAPDAFNELLRWLPP